MEKCSLPEHNEIDAIYFCEKCKLYMCYKCELFHSYLFKNHNPKKIREIKESEDIFIELCQVQNHLVDLQYFCKSHNQLCCAKCITKIKSEENGQHTNCEICLIEKIEKEKKEKLKQNLKYLEDLSINLEQSIKEIKEISEKVLESKDQLKLYIQKIFTKLRSALNEREDALLIEVDNKFDELCFDEQIIRKYEKLPNKVKIYLEKGKLLEQNWENNKKLNRVIHECLNFENVINDINSIKEKTKNFKTEKKQFKFYILNDMDNNLIKTIKEFGLISHTEPKKEEPKIEKKDNNEDIKLKTSYFVKSQLHEHPVELLRRYISAWFCDVCRKSFKDKIPSYHCTLCDFDVCYNCIKDKVTKGVIKEQMKEFY